MTFQHLPSDAKVPNSAPVDFLVIFSQREELDEFLSLCDVKDNESEYQVVHIGRERSAEFYRVALAVSGQTNARSQDTAQRAIWRLTPRAVILTGICAGLEGSAVRLGDIIVPRWIVPYEHEKISERPASAGQIEIGDLDIEFRDWPHDVSATLWSSAEPLAHHRSELWSRHLLPRPEDQTGKISVHMALDAFVASGDKNLATEAADVRQRLVKMYKTKLKGFEMEAYGTLVASRAADRPFIMIKAVQDFGTKQKNEAGMQDVWRQFACRAAASFTYALIQSHNFLIELSSVTGPEPKVRTLVHWNDRFVSDILSRCQNSIEIVDSFYDEATYLTPHILDAVFYLKSKPSISIFMVDPDGPFGAQRLIERDDPKATGKATVTRYKLEYQKIFERECGRLFAAFKNNPDLKRGGIRPNLFKYNAMPGMRMIVVDDAFFVVGWYPLSDSNPAYPCLLIDASSQALSDQMAVRKFRQQLKEIRAISIPVTDA